MLDSEAHCPANREPEDLKEEHKDFALPSWRIIQIVTIALDILVEEDFFSNEFDYMEMIRRKGIRIKPYSTFSPENLRKLSKMSLSFWQEGLCLVNNDEKQGQCMMIAYNDNNPDDIKMLIIMHEFAHIVLKHTQQCEQGEAEALCFASVMMTAFSFEPSLNTGSGSGKAGGKSFLHSVLVRYIKSKQQEGKIKKNEA